MPTWSESELRLVGDDNTDWEKKLVIFGGVPRFIFSDENAVADLENNLEQKGGEIMKQYMTHGLNSVDNTMNYMLIHINPDYKVVDNNFKTIYHGKPQYSFASDHIFKIENGRVTNWSSFPAVSIKLVNIAKKLAK
jgi:hypothetical protein